MAGESYTRRLDYTAGYYPETAPVHMDFGLFCAGAAAAGPLTKMLELGCGQGFGLALLAAANPDLAFEGVDFNAGHIEHGRALAEPAGLANLAFAEADFLDLAARGGPRDCDCVVAHGVLSWVGPPVQQALLEVVGQRLKAGGRAMISYECLPGGAGFLPLRQAMLMARRLAPDDAALALNVAFALLAGLRAGNAEIFVGNPALEAAVADLPGRDPAYLVHDYFAEEARPLAFAEVADRLAQAGLTYAASAAVSQNFAPLGPCAGLLEAFPQSGVIARETLRDLMANRAFRRDVFVRGAQAGAGGAPRFRLIVPAALRIADIPGAGATAPLCAPILDLLAKGEAGHDAIAALPACRAVAPALLNEALARLVEAGQIAALSGPPPRDFDPARRFNRQIIAAARQGRIHGHLAAPAIRAGVAVDDFALLALAAHEEGATAPEQAAQCGLEMVARLGRRPCHDGAPIDDDGAALAFLEARLRPYCDHWISIWRDLGII